MINGLGGAKTVQSPPRLGALPDRGTSKLKSLCSMEYRYRLQKKISHIYHIAFLIHKRYIPDPEQLNQQRFNCAAQMRETL